MEETTGLIGAVLVLALAAAGLAMTERLRLPSVVGFLVVGALAGPGGFGLVSDPDSVRSLAELGIVFLLFEIGLELPIERIRGLWRPTLLGGGFQVVATVGLVAWAALALGLGGGGTALVIGACVAMSSTAVVLRLLADEGQIDAPAGQISVAILLFQDLAIVLFLLMVPLLAGHASDVREVGFAVGKMALALGVVGFSVWFLVPRVLDRVAQARSTELFSMLALLIVLGSALAAEELGLTLAVGAFLAGAAASASLYAHQLFSEVVPLRGVLLGIFFTAVGMLFEPATVLEQPATLLFDVGAIMLGKIVIVTFATVILLRRSLRVGIETGLTLCQMGEFSFVLLGVAAEAGLIEPVLQQRFVAATFVTLLISPFLIRFAPAIAGAISERLDATGSQTPDVPTAPVESRTRVVVIGFGPAGQTLVRLLRSLDVPYIAVDTNPNAALDASRTGEPVVYGDATRPQVLTQLGVDTARLVAVAISDPLATRRIVTRINTMAPETPILARTRYVREVDRLSMAGANIVVAEEFEGSIELVARALESFDVPTGAIARFTEALREEGYGAIRAPAALPIDPWLMELLDHTDTEWIEVPIGLEGEPTLGELNIRARTGGSILVVERGESSHANPPPDFALAGGDRLLVLGNAENLVRLRHLLESPPGRTP